MRILMKDANNPIATWEALVPMVFEDESELQALLDRGSSELLPPDPSSGDDYVVYARELPTASGPIDLIGIGSSGSVTIMECKLAQNHDIKRKVVGQVLDYAASLWETDVASLVATFMSRTGSDPFQALRDKFGSDADAFDEELCRSEVARRLREGDFRLLIAVDQVDSELWRIIRYVNSRGADRQGLRLVALAFQRFEQGSTQVLVPEVYGDELSQPQQSRVLTTVQRLHLDYWTAFRDYLLEQDGQVQMGNPRPTSIADSKIGTTGVLFRAWNCMIDGYSGVAAKPRTDAAASRFAALAREDRQRVAETLGQFGDVYWKPPSEEASVWVTWHGTPTDREAWPGLMKRMAGALEALRTLFSEGDV